MFHIVIDGYNLLHASRGRDHDWTCLSLEEARVALVNFLATHRQPSREEITVVFDGSGEVAAPRVHRVRGVNIIFSDAGVNADEVIREMVAAAPNPKSILVVTDDRQIKNPAIAAGAKVVGSANFLERAEEESEKRRKAPPREPREKYTGVEAGQVEFWRKLFGFDDQSERDKKDENAGGRGRGGK